MFTIQLTGRSSRIRPGKIVALGRNYTEHIKELGNAIPDKPVIFIKPTTSLLPEGDDRHPRLFERLSPRN